MNILSLFDGIACGREALKRTPICVDNYFASEIDRQCIDIAMKNHSDIQQIGAVESVTKDILPEIELLIGGSPCTGFSYAGKQEGFHDPRSRLFFEYLRILEEVKPKYFLLENVVMKKEFSDVISEKLGVQPIMLNSSLVSAQNRKRLYWTNFPITIPTDKGIKLRSILQKEEEFDSKYYLSDKAVCSIQKRQSSSWIKTRKAPCLTLELSHLWGFNFSPRWCYEIGSYRRCTPIEAERLQTLPDNYTAGFSDTARYKMLGNCWTVDIISHILEDLNELYL